MISIDSIEVNVLSVESDTELRVSMLDTKFEGPQNYKIMPKVDQQTMFDSVIKL